MRSIEFISDSWKGVQKNTNQDGVHYIQTSLYTLFIVFDGVSSSPDSLEGVKYLKKFCSQNYARYETETGFNLSHLMQDMNLELVNSPLNSPQTTCCMVYIPVDIEKKIWISHLGDSRIYSIGDQIECLTIDDNHPQIPHMLVKCLGISKLTTDDFYQKPLADGISRLLVCTDGFYHVMEEYQEEFDGVLMTSSNNLKNISKNIELITRYKNGDDASYILIDISKKERVK